MEMEKKENEAREKKEKILKKESPPVIGLALFFTIFLAKQLNPGYYLFFRMPKRPKPSKSMRKGPIFTEWFREHVSSSDPTNTDIEKYGKYLDDPGMQGIEDAKRMQAWDRMAPHYNKILPLASVRNNLDYISSIAHFSGNENVLSLGSGTGVLENFIAKYRVPNGKVIAVDISHQMNLQAKELAKRAGVTNLHLVTGNIKTRFLQEHSQDVILLVQPSYVSHAFKELQEVRRLIKNSEKAKFILCTIIERTSQLDMLRQAVTQRGFSIVNEKVEKKQGAVFVYLTASPIIYR